MTGPGRPHTTGNDLLVLHGLRCMGFTSLARVAEATGLPEGETESELIDLAVAGLVTKVAAEADVVARGLGACPGVAVGRLATTADRAAQMAAGGPVILVRPETSPLDLHGLAAAAGVVTARGGPASHAAVVARAMGKPAVVGVAGLTVDAAGAAVHAGGRTVPEGELITIDGSTGEVVAGSPPLAPAAADSHLGRLLDWADEVSGDTSKRPRPNVSAPLMPPSVTGRP